MSCIKPFQKLRQKYDYFFTLFVNPNYAFETIRKKPHHAFFYFPSPPPTRRYGLRCCMFGDDSQTLRQNVQCAEVAGDVLCHPRRREFAENKRCRREVGF